MGDNDKEVTETDAPENTEAQQQKSGSRLWKKILVSSGIAVAVLAASYLGGAAFYNSHFFFNTGIGGVDCSNLSAEAAKEKLENEINNYTFTFYEKNGEEEVIKGEEIHLTHSPIENM